MTKLVIFDLDGTVMDAYSAVWASINHSLRKTGYPLKSHALIKRSVGWGDVNLIRRFVQEADLQKVVTIYRRHHAKALAKGVKFLPEAKRSLGLLRKKGIRLAVASNRPTRFSLIALKALGIRGYFDAVVCADKVRRGKPHPDMFRAILTKLSVKPREALYVGDMTIDAVAGRRAKIRTVIVLTGSCPRSEIVPLKPFAVIRSLKELPKFLSLGPSGK